MSDAAFVQASQGRAGATAVEYGLILALIFLAMVGAVTTFAGTTTADVEQCLQAQVEGLVAVVKRLETSILIAQQLPTRITKDGRREVWTSNYVEPRRPEMLFIRKLIRNKKGATAIEYGLIAALIAVAAITAMQGLGTASTRPSPTSRPR